MPTITASCPHFVVANIETAVDYYVGVLGFERPELWGEPPSFAMPHRDGFVVMLNQIEGTPPKPNGEGIWDAYIWCDDADALFAEFESSGAEIIHAPEDRQLYGMREFAVRDPDGHMIAFASDLST